MRFGCTDDTKGGLIAAGCLGAAYPYGKSTARFLSGEGGHKTIPNQKTRAYNLSVKTLSIQKYLYPGLFPVLCFGLAACGGGEEYEGDEGTVGRAEQEIKVCPGPVTVEGIDVSGWQPNTNWPPVKASGREFAFVKATENTGYVNPYFKQDWDGIKAAGMLRGAYHYFHADTDPIAQADHFLSTMGPLEFNDLPPVLDLEETMGQSNATITSRALAFLDHLEKNTGKTPIIYTGPYFFDTYVNNHEAFTKYPLWVANYGVMCPSVPGQWPTFTFWQYTSTGPVPGVQGSNVDQNVFNGTLDQLIAFANGGARPLAQQNSNGTISAVNWPDTKHTEVFVINTKGDMLHAWTDGLTDTWNPLGALDSGASCGFASGFRMGPVVGPDVISPKAGGSTQKLGWLGMGWDTFSDLGGSGLSKISTLTWGDGHLEAFALGSDGAIWHNYQNTSDNSWSGWISMGGTFMTGVSAIVWGDGHAEILATDANGTPWLNFSGNFDGGWFGWMELEGQLSSRPVTARWADGHIEAFARGKDGQLYHSYFDANLNKWIPFEGIAPGTLIEGEPSVVMNIAGQGALAAGPSVFARDEMGRVVYLDWDGAAYTSFKPLGDALVDSDPLAFSRPDGRVEVFAVDQAGQLIHAVRGDTGFSTWFSLGGGDINPCVLTTNPGTGGGGPGSSSSSGGTSSGGNPATPGDEEGGCSCRAAGSGEDGWGGWVVSLGLSAVWFGRNKKKRRAG